MRSPFPGMNPYLETAALCMVGGSQYTTNNLSGLCYGLSKDNHDRTWKA